MHAALARLVNNEETRKQEKINQIPKRSSREAELSRLVNEAKAELQRHRKAIHEVRRAQEDASLETPRTGRAMVMRAAGGALGSWRGRD